MAIKVLAGLVVAIIVAVWVQDAGVVYGRLHPDQEAKAAPAAVSLCKKSSWLSIWHDTAKTGK